MSEYSFVEKPFLDQLAAIGWTVINQGPGILTDPAKRLRTHFLVELPVHPELAGLMVHDETQDGVQDELSEAERKVLDFVAEKAKSKSEIAVELGLSPRGRAIHRLLEGLLASDLIQMTLPDKPSSPNQKYKTTPLRNSKRAKQ